MSSTRAGPVPAAGEATGTVADTDAAAAAGAQDREQAQEHDRPFAEVYAEDRSTITRLAFLLVRSMPVAEELAQEAFVRLYERYADVANPPAFLRTVVVRLGIDWMRRHDMEQQRLTIVGAGHRGVGEPELDETWAALGNLRHDRRAVLVLRFYEDLSHKQIAEVLGCPPATVRSRTRRALADLRKQLGENREDEQSDA
jgi:RNA polymerase sigma factor (sigma-70 family)